METEGRKSPRTHIVSIEEAKTWKPRQIAIKGGALGKDPYIFPIFAGKRPEISEVAKVNELYLGYQEGEDRGSLKDIEVNDIIVIKDGDCEIRRLRYLSSGASGGISFLEFEVLEQ